MYRAFITDSLRLGAPYPTRVAGVLRVPSDRRVPVTLGSRSSSTRVSVGENPRPLGLHDPRWGRSRGGPSVWGPHKCRSVSVDLTNFLRVHLFGTHVDETRCGDPVHPSPVPRSVRGSGSFPRRAEWRGAVRTGWVDVESRGCHAGSTDRVSDPSPSFILFPVS